MPYINKEDRESLDPYLSDLNPAADAGQLNFQITRLVDDFVGSKISYAKINEAIGVLECAKLELYRRIAAPYEDKKMAQNGDVYDCRIGL